jgi:hypothetical protein
MSWGALTVINTSHRWPELPLLETRDRVSSLGATVRPVPRAITVTLDEIQLRVGGHLEDIALPWLAALLDVTDLLADADQSISQAVKLLFALAFRRFDHECVGDGEAQGGRVEAVVLQALGNVSGFDAGRSLEGAGVEDELVGAATLIIRVHDRVVRLQAGQEVVSIKEGHGSSLAESVVT